MAESFRTCLYRWGFNFFPAYRGTGARITYIAADWREVRVIDLTDTEGTVCASVEKTLYIRRKRQV